jgi:hypothetical protein
MDLQFTLQGKFIISHLPNLPKHRRRIRSFLCSSKREKQKASHSAMDGRASFDSGVLSCTSYTDSSVSHTLSHVTPSEYETPLSPLVADSRLATFGHAVKLRVSDVAERDWQ